MKLMLATASSSIVSSRPLDTPHYFRYAAPPHHTATPGGIMEPTTNDALITREQLLKHWQGHRALSRKTIEAFPEDQLFTFSIGGMRTFGELANEMLGMAGPSLEGV